ncbi:hypothetical protein E8E12_010966 [Didymella heteroderae]|uniref:Uncharacterized protein n=1 Tax=Didymella heteroderae TaxID=1769908 RepID=A0A9P4WX03_9PLEO|nr:hypothetical protein E8E12_010966 [Didymella heteroderae]
MCRFTRIFWTQCNHYTLSDTPQHTELCDLARGPDEEICQGFDKAPAFCHPLPEDLQELGTQYRDSDRIAQTNCLFTLCDMCKQNPDFTSEPRGTGTEVEKPVEQFDEYTDDDRMDLTKWRDLLLSDTIKAEAVINDLQGLLTNDHETITAAIHRIGDATTQRAFLNPDSPERSVLFERSHLEAARLLVIIENYMVIRMPRKFVNDLIEPKAYEAAINSHADKLMMRLGHPAVPDADTFEHLAIEMPQHVQETIATKENVRRLSIHRHTSAVRTHAYAPRSAFGPGKNTKALTVDLERAWNPPPERRGDLPFLRKTGESVEVVYDVELETFTSPSHMGVGRWGRDQILAQRETLGFNRDGQDEFDVDDDTLVDSPEGPGKPVSSLAVTVSREATFMGMPLEDSDDEVSDADGVDRGQKADRQDAGRQESARTDVDRARTKRDENGWFAKKRKCSA